jgi:hypothetical protein
MPAEIKYAVSFSMLNIQAERRPFVPPERAGPSASLNAPMSPKPAHFHLGSARRRVSFVLFLRFRWRPCSLMDLLHQGGDQHPGLSVFDKFDEPEIFARPIEPCSILSVDDGHHDNERHHRYRHRNRQQDYLPMF